MIRAAILVLAGLILAGCGADGEPVPPTANMAPDVLIAHPGPGPFAVVTVAEV